MRAPGGRLRGQRLLRREDVMRVVNKQVLLPERRVAFSYNSTAYDLVGEAIEHLSGGTSVADVCRTRIFEPLGLPRTFMNPPPSVVTDNVAICYNALDDGTPVRIPSPRIGEEGIGAASGGLWSCSTDLVKFYGAFLRSYRHQVATGQTTTPGSPLKHVAHMMSAQVSMPETAQHTLSYGMGWACVQLPNTLGTLASTGARCRRKYRLWERVSPASSSSTTKARCQEHWRRCCCFQTVTALLWF